MANSLITKLQTAMQLYSPFASLLALRADGAFAIYDTQLAQGTAFPAITLNQISRVRQYSINALLNTAQYRIQFNAYAPLPGSDTARAIVAAIEAFLTGFNAYNLGDSNPIQRNQVVGTRPGGIADTSPATYLLMTDAMIWNNESF